jgi:hypothetical protein
VKSKINITIIKYFIVLLILNLKVNFLNGQYREFRKLYEIIESNKIAKNDIINIRLEQLRRNDESLVVYNFALALKLYKVDKKYLEAYHAVIQCANLFNDLSEKEEMKIP